MKSNTGSCSPRCVWLISISSIMTIAFYLGCGSPRPGSIPQPTSGESAETSGHDPVDTAAELNDEVKRPPVLQQLESEAERLAPLIRSPWVRRLVEGVRHLPPVGSRVVYVSEDTNEAWSEAQAAALPRERLETLERKEFDEGRYYAPHGTPLAYARALDLAAEHGLDGVSGRRVLDFGFGGVGQIRLLALLGADVVGVEVSPVIAALYSNPADVGEVPGPSGITGRITLVDGQWPADEKIREAVGGGFDLFIAKNVLKNGYIHPAEPVPDRQRIDFGVEDAEFVRALREIMAPGGLVVIYNICPAPAPPGEPYIPWADGRSPFPRAMYEEAGLEVLAFDVDDGPAMHEMGRVFEWDRGEEPWDLENDMLVWYTMLRVPPS